MQVSARGVALIAEFEGFRPELYNDPAGNCTIGYGFLIHPGRCDGRAAEQQYVRGIDERTARAELAAKAKTYASFVQRFATAPLTQNQFDAMTSFCYNVGPTGFRDSTVCAAINRSDYAAAARELLTYVHGNDGIQYPGLVRRRHAEAALFNTPQEAPMATPTADQLLAIARLFTAALALTLAGRPLPPEVYDQIKWLISQPQP